MKTYTLYGFFMALAGMVLTLVLYFLGFHSDPAKFSTAQIIGSVGGLAFGITFIVLGTQARRAEWPVAEDFSYGNAFAAGFLITLAAAVIGIFTNFLYFQVINPGISEIIVQAQLDKLEAKGLSAAQMERAEKSIRFFLKPGMTAAFGFIGGLFWGTIISLITAAFLKRPAVEAIKEGEVS
ncbi:MAG: DUF4199 domain-containing protein [Verrucomicrobia bacterium]|nr:DUF4199 domain-containing protein [Verrucomicrobiota bacterium]